MSIRLIGKVSGDVVIVEVELVNGKQDKRTEVCRPTDSIRRQIVKDMPDGHVVDGKDQFALFGLPDGNSPIPDDAPKAVGIPLIKRGSDDRDIGCAVVEIAAQFRDESFTVIETTIPHKDESPACKIRLFLQTYFPGRVESAIDHSHRA